MIAYGYLRHLIPCPKSPTGNGSHRFACVAIERAPIPNNYRVSVYLHNPKQGAFRAKYARMAAVGRLNNDEKSCIVTFDQLRGGNGIDLIMTLNLGLSIYRYGHIKDFDTVRNGQVLNGMIKEVDMAHRVGPVATA